MRMKPLLLILLVILPIYCRKMQHTIVRLKGNMEVRGTLEKVDAKKVQQFLGIPYANVAKRFDAPTEHKGWQGILEATSLKPACWQPDFGGFDVINKGAKMWANNTVMDEDCLYLNVWAPDTSNGIRAKKLPVMVWIYGGGFYSGSSYLDVYDGKFLAATQDVIVVSMQYRVGPFGFLFLDPDKDGKSGTTNDETALGNQGLLDQTMALKWVKENIGYFNGDENSITIFGESAGAVSVSLLWLSDQSRQYINRAIMESGSFLARWGLSTKEDAHARGEELLKACNCSSSTEGRSAALECLRNKSPHELANIIWDINLLSCQKRNDTIKKNLNEEYNKLLARDYSTCLYFDAPLRPVLYKSFLPDSEAKLLDAIKSVKSPDLLIGVNKNEGMYFLLYGLAANGTTFLNHDDGTVNLPTSMKNEGSEAAQANGEFVTLSIGEIIGTDLMKKGVAKKPADFYGLGTNVAPKREELMNRLDHMTGDLDFICPTLEFADHVSKENNANVFLYSFEKRSANFPMPGWLGVMHGYEIEYVFGMPLSLTFSKNFYTFTSEEMDFSRKVMALWANFAKYGDPNKGSSPLLKDLNWPKYEQPSKKYFVINEKFKTSKDLRGKACRFWSELKKEAEKK